MNCIITFTPNKQSIITTSWNISHVVPVPLEVVGSNWCGGREGRCHFEIYNKQVSSHIFVVKTEWGISCSGNLLNQILLQCMPAMLQAICNLRQRWTYILQDPESFPPGNTLGWWVASELWVRSESLGVGKDGEPSQVWVKSSLTASPTIWVPIPIDWYLSTKARTKLNLLIFKVLCCFCFLFRRHVKVSVNFNSPLE